MPANLALVCARGVERVYASMKVIGIDIRCVDPDISWIDAMSTDLDGEW